MNNTNSKIKTLVKRIGIFVIGILLLISLYDIVKPNGSKLTIDTDPQDATIKIDDQEVGSGHYEKRMSNGKYTITATKDGYNSEVRNITLDKSTSLTLKLTQSVSPATPKILRATGFVNTTLGTEGSLYGIDVRNGNLVSSQNGSTSTIYEGNVRDFSVSGETTVILDDRNFSQVIVLNTRTRTSRTLDLSNYAPVISVALSDDSQILYFLAKFDLEKKNPVLYSMNVQGGEPVQIIETKALYVDFVKDSKVILYEDVHALDQGIIHLIDTVNKRELFLDNANSFEISPDKKYVAYLTSTTIKVLNTDNLTTDLAAATIGDTILWADNSNLILTRNRNGNFTELAYVSLNPFTISSFTKILDGKHIQSLYGIENNILIFQDYDGTMSSVELPRRP